MNKHLKTSLMAIAAALSLGANAADAGTYIASRTVGTTGSVNLSITTDGTVGQLAAANIIGWTISVSDGSNSFTLTDANSTLYVTGNNLSATAGDLLFNFVNSGGFVLFQAGSGGPFFCFQGTACYDYSNSPGEGLDPVAADNIYQISLYSGSTVVASDATVSAVPEPASWALLIGGFGMIGGTLRRRSSRVSFA